MPRRIILDEWHITITVPPKLSQPDCKAILRVLRSKRFHKNLVKATRAVFRRHKALRKTRLRLDR